MKTSIGLWNQLFGEKVTLEIPDPNGTIVKRTVTKKWLDQMIDHGKISIIFIK